MQIIKIPAFIGDFLFPRKTLRSKVMGVVLEGLAIVVMLLMIPLGIWIIVKVVCYIVYSIRKAWLKAETDLKTDKNN